MKRGVEGKFQDRLENLRDFSVVLTSIFFYSWSVSHVPQRIIRRGKKGKQALWIHMRIERATSDSLFVLTGICVLIPKFGDEVSVWFVGSRRRRDVKNPI